MQWNEIRAALLRRAAGKFPSSFSGGGWGWNAPWADIGADSPTQGHQHGPLG